MFTLTDFTAIFSTWHIARAAGLTAFLLLFVITTCGLVLSLQLASVKYRLMLVSMHKKSLYSLFLFTLLHGLILLFDKHMPFSLADVFIPFWSDYHSWSMALGIVAFYTLLIITITAIPVIIKTLGHKLWRYVHYLAFPCYWLALYHGLTVGTDSSNHLVLMLYALTAGITGCLTLLRVWKSLKKRGYHYANSTCGR